MKILVLLHIKIMIYYLRKILGSVSSSREQGNCLNNMKYCLDKMKIEGNEIEIINI